MLTSQRSFNATLARISLYSQSILMSSVDQNKLLSVITVLRYRSRLAALSGENLVGTIPSRVMVFQLLFDGYGAKRNA